jgi:hypothetical protein
MWAAATTKPIDFIYFALLLSPDLGCANLFKWLTLSISESPFKIRPFTNLPLGYQTNGQVED